MVFHKMQAIAELLRLSRDLLHVVLWRQEILVGEAEPKIQAPCLKNL